MWLIGWKTKKATKAYQVYFKPYVQVLKAAWFLYESGSKGLIRHIISPRRKSAFGITTCRTQDQGNTEQTCQTFHQELVLNERCAKCECSYVCSVL